jgi:hypothetical protein
MVCVYEWKLTTVMAGASGNVWWEKPSTSSVRKTKFSQMMKSQFDLLCNLPARRERSGVSIAIGSEPVKAGVLFMEDAVFAFCIEKKILQFSQRPLLKGIRQFARRRDRLCGTMSHYS